MFKFIIQALLFFLLLYSNKKEKDRWLTPSGVLFAIYALCSSMAVPLLMGNDYITPQGDSYWMALLTFDFFVFLFLLPFRCYNETQINIIRLPSKRFLDVFSTIIIFLSIFSIIYYVRTVSTIFSLGSLGDARNLRYSQGEFIEAGLLTTIASVSSANYVFAIALYFIYQILGNSKVRCWLLLLSSLSNPIHILAFVGRDGILFWIFTFAFCYAFFSPFLNRKFKKKIRKVFIGGVLLLSVPFLLISMSRFSDSDLGGGGTIGAIVSYTGEAFIQGPLFWGLDEKPLQTGNAFPLYYEIIGKSQPKNDVLMEKGEWKSWHFGTLVVTLYLSLGLGGLIAFIIIMTLLFRVAILPARKHIDFGQITLYMLFFQIVSQGVFYFRQAERGGNLFIITTMILSLYFSMKCKDKGKSIVIKMQK